MNRMRVFLLACLGGMMIAGCVSRPTRLEADYGRSYQTATVNQIYDYSAVGNDDPVDGFDGRAARQVMDRYREAFEAPPPVQFVLPGGGLQ